jgi:hypothetical protein
MYLREGLYEKGGAEEANMLGAHCMPEPSVAPLDGDITQSSDSDHTLAHSPNPQAVANHDFGAAGHTKVGGRAAPSAGPAA